ncbi:hypothetical protein CC2G_013879 [Coprinopsis cinerea AmutBmut pab1-1]|nr:hypothetical protein CC2G_013879 [Coprinopsis cinerea AmutBmut pab1-1]
MSAVLDVKTGDDEGSRSPSWGLSTMFNGRGKDEQLSSVAWDSLALTNLTFNCLLSFRQGWRHEFVQEIKHSNVQYVQDATFGSVGMTINNTLRQ